jgi:hypothetical protein
MKAVMPEFSRVVPEEAVAGGEVVRQIEAGPGECRALAARFGLVAVDHLDAVVRLRRLDGGRMVRVRGRLSADVVQTCVVTLEPVPARVVEEFGALFAPPAMIPVAGPDDSGDLVLDPFALDEDAPEAMTGAGIDIGELTAQHLSLALDPYPRRPGATFTGFDDGAADAEAVTNPFKALALLKRSD